MPSARLRPEAEGLEDSVMDDVKGQVSKSRAGARGLLMVSLSRFYGQGANLREVLPYVDGSAPISLRLIDWFVTNYAKKHNIVLARRTGSGEVASFNVYLSYRSQLKAYSKQQFDPFRRRDRITFYYDVHGGAIETTVGQLNFFRWMLTNNVLAYVRDHIEHIESDMIAFQKGENEERPDARKSRPAEADKGRADRAQADKAQADKVQADKAQADKGRRARTGKRKEITACTAVNRMSRMQGDRLLMFT